jgi:predicted porin
MRNTKIALAVLALVASTAAMADGTTVYGSLDASMAKTSTGNLSFDGSGNWGGSYFGIKGSEDLDGGMKVNYTLEGGLNIGTGAQDNGGTNGTVANATTATKDDANATVFNRQGNVGLSGDFGSVTAGMQISPYIGAMANGIAGGNSFFVPLLIMSSNRTADGASVTGTGATANNGFFIPNAVSYTSPSMGGFSATVLSQVSAGVDANKYTAYSGNFAQGDVSIAAAYQSKTNDYSSTAATAGYQMGPLRLSGGYVKHSDTVTALDTNTYTVGAAYAVTEKATVNANYARNNATNAATITNLSAYYSLSKNTGLYATYSRGTNGAGTLYSTRGDGLGGASTASQTGYAVGIRKMF